MIDEVYAEDAAPPGGHYSHAVRANGFVFVSGVLPVPELHHGFSVEIELTAIDSRRHDGQST